MAFFPHIVDENKYFLILLLVNNHNGNVLVTTNVSGLLEINHLKPRKTVVVSKKWKTKTLVTVSAIDAATNLTVNINGESLVYLEPTIKESVSLKVLYIKGKNKIALRLFNLFVVASVCSEARCCLQGIGCVQFDITALHAAQLAAVGA